MPATKGRPDGAPDESRDADVVENGLPVRTDRGTSSAAARPAVAAEDKDKDKDDKKARGMASRARAEEKDSKRANRGRVRPEPARLPEPSPRWWAPVMVTLMVVGLLWVVVFYTSHGTVPIPPLGNWNILVGFAFMLVGFLMTTRWR